MATQTGQANPLYKIDKLISCGQTGACIGALVGARRLSIKTGGTAARNFNTEKGCQEEALKGFGLVMHPSAIFRDIAKENIKNSDATLILSPNPDCPETIATIKCCDEDQKPYCLLFNLDHNDIKTARMFLTNWKAKILHVTGSSESISPGLSKTTASFIVSLFIT